MAINGTTPEEIEKDYLIFRDFILHIGTCASFGIQSEIPVLIELARDWSRSYNVGNGMLEADEHQAIIDTALNRLRNFHEVLTDEREKRYKKLKDL